MYKLGFKIIIKWAVLSDLRRCGHVCWRHYLTDLRLAQMKYTNLANRTESILTKWICLDLKSKHTADNEYFDHNILAGVDNDLHLSYQWCSAHNESSVLSLTAVTPVIRFFQKVQGALPYMILPRLLTK